MPLRWRPSMARSRGLVAPAHSTRALKSFRNFAAGTVLPTSVLVTNFTPAFSINSTRRRTTFLSSFMFGMPYISNPPTRSARSNTVTSWPALLSCSAAASPDGPEPTTATLLSVRFAGAGTWTHPFSHPRSIISHSICLIVTAGSFMPRTHEPSHGAGHTRPVNSGKLLVFINRSSASNQRPRYTRSFHSGIRLLIGQPDAIPASRRPTWQNGTPQSMQRAPCSLSLSSGRCRWNSFQCLSRSSSGWSCGSSRLNSMNPVGLPMFVTRNS